MTGRVVEGLAAPVMAVRDLAIAAGMDAVDAVKRKLGEKERLAKTEKRRKYYATDAARRERQREQIREARPQVVCKCPTAKELTEAYVRRRERRGRSGYRASTTSFGRFESCAECIFAQSKYTLKVRGNVS